MLTHAALLASSPTNITFGACNLVCQVPGPGEGFTVACSEPLSHTTGSGTAKGTNLSYALVMAVRAPAAVRPAPPQPPQIGNVTRQLGATAGHVDCSCTAFPPAVVSRGCTVGGAYCAYLDHGR